MVPFSVNGMTSPSSVKNAATAAIVAILATSREHPSAEQICISAVRTENLKGDVRAKTSERNPSWPRSRANPGLNLSSSTREGMATANAETVGQGAVLKAPGPR